jgi:hypothetical protein
MAEIDLLIKLFDTLKDSMKDQQTVHNALLNNQNDIGNYMKTLPIEEIKLMLKEHSKESILAEVKDIKGKIKNMILVVIVAVSLFGIALLIGGIAFNNVGSKKETISHEYIKEIIEEYHKQDSERKE